MVTRTPHLHVVIGKSAGASLREAMEMTGRADTVLAIGEDFSFGPIDFQKPQDRLAGIERDFGYPNWPEFHADTTSVLDAVLADGRKPVVWVSSASAESRSGYLWLLSQIGHRQISLLEIPRLATLPPARLVEYLDSEMSLPDTKRARDLAIWTRLKTENAPLRILADGELVSAPIEHFDPVLLGHLERDWRRMLRIVGMAMGELHEEHESPSDLILISRLLHLAEDGRLEIRGNRDDLRACDVRLPTSH